MIIGSVGQAFWNKITSISVVAGSNENVSSMAQCIVKRELRFFLFMKPILTRIWPDGVYICDLEMGSST